MATSQQGDAARGESFQLGCAWTTLIIFLPIIFFWPMLREHGWKLRTYLGAAWTIIYALFLLLILLSPEPTAEDRERWRQAALDREVAREARERDEQARAAREEVDEEREQAAAEEACRRSPQCRRDRLNDAVREHAVDARTQCQMLIESMARYDHDWTNGVFEQWYSRVEWGAPRPEDQRYIQYRGNALRLQNGFGAWSRHSYECEYDTRTRRAIDARIY